MWQGGIITKGGRAHMELIMKERREYQDAEKIKSGTMIRIAVAESNPDKQEAKKKLAEIKAELATLENAYKEMLNAIKSSKKRVSKAITDIIIDESEIKVTG